MGQDEAKIYESHRVYEFQRRRKMKNAQLNFLGMSQYITIEDNQTHYTIDLPTQKPTLELNQTFGVNRKKGNNIISEIQGKIRLVFVIFPNKHYETDKSNASECFAEFSHVEIIE